MEENQNALPGSSTEFPLSTRSGSRQSRSRRRHQGEISVDAQSPSIVHVRLRRPHYYHQLDSPWSLANVVYSEPQSACTSRELSDSPVRMPETDHGPSRRIFRRRLIRPRDDILFDDPQTLHHSFSPRFISGSSSTEHDKNRSKRR